VPAEDFYECYYENKPQVCPVCGGKVRYQDWSEEFSCVETIEDCRDCNYSHSWAYGRTDLLVGEWSARYNTSIPYKEIEQIDREFSKQIVLERNRRKIEIRKYYRKRG
jgi:hypothetical protein